MRTYLAIDLSSRKFYVGSTTNFDRRWRDHYKNTDNLPFQNALRNRPDQFYWIVTEDDGLDTREEEQFYLDFYHGSPWCFNVSSSTNRPEVSSEVRSQIAKETHRKHPDLGKRMGKASQEKNPGKGAETLKKFKEENPENYREYSVKGGQATAKKHAKPVVCLETGETYSSAKEAMRQTGINDANIGTACKSGRKAGGYHWNYLKSHQTLLKNDH